MADRRLLVVDDEASVEAPMRRFFERRGFAVSVAGSVAEALESFRSSPPTAAILDYALPDGDGLELLRRFRAMDSTVPCVVLTAHGSLDLAARAKQEGAGQFFTKPVELSAIHVALERLLAG